MRTYKLVFKFFNFNLSFFIYIISLCYDDGPNIVNFFLYNVFDQNAFKDYIWL